MARADHLPAPAAGAMPFIGQRKTGDIQEEEAWEEDQEVGIVEDKKPFI